MQELRLSRSPPTWDWILLLFLNLVGQAQRLTGNQRILVWGLLWPQDASGRIQGLWKLQVPFVTWQFPWGLDATFAAS